MSDLFDKRFLDEMLSLSQKAVNILSEIKKKKKEREAFKASHSIGNEEWEIESYITDSFGIKGEIFRRDDICFVSERSNGIHPIAEQYLTNAKATIHSVLRKSDGVVLSVNSETDKGNIERFEINEDRMYVWTKYSWFRLDQIQPLPQRTKPPLGPLSREVEKLEERMAYIEKKLNIEG